MGLLSSITTSIRSRPVAAAQRQEFADPAWVRENLRPLAQPTPSGGSGVVISYGQILGEEENDEVLREKWYGDIQKPGVADTMIRTDAHIRATLAAVVNPIQNAIWDARPASKVKEHQEHAAFVRRNVFRALAWDRFIRQALDYLKAGFSLFEVLTDVVDVPAELFPLHPSPVMANGKKRVLWITGLEPRLPRTVSRWVMDPANPSRVKAVEQWIPKDDTNPKTGTRLLEARRASGAPGLIRFSFDQVGNDPEGLAQLRSVYFAWKTKRALIMLDCIRHERQNLGVPTIKLPPGFNKDDEAKAKKIAEALRGHERAYIVLPSGFIFEWNVTGQGQGTNVQQAIDRCDREIWMNVHAPFMLLGGNGDTGSYALAETINDVRLLGLEGHTKLLSEPFNVGVDCEALVPWLIRVNYGEQAEYPWLCATNLPTRDWKQIVPEVVNAIRAGAITADDPLEAHLRGALYLPPHDPATARKSETLMSPVDDQNDVSPVKEEEDE